jgi:hypothetical protein
VIEVPVVSSVALTNANPYDVLAAAFETHDADAKEPDRSSEPAK